MRAEATSPDAGTAGVRAQAPDPTPPRGVGRNRIHPKVSQFAPTSVWTCQPHENARNGRTQANMPMREGTAERREELYREAMALIARDYARDLQLEGGARTLATSRRQLQRAFSEVGDTSFRDELAKVRMHHARVLLAADAIPVRAVAARVGYHQPAQFAKSFRRHHGQSPSSYRKQRRAVGAHTPLAQARQQAAMA